MCLKTEQPQNTCFRFSVVVVVVVVVVVATIVPAILGVIYRAILQLQQVCEISINYSKLFDYISKTADFNQPIISDSQGYITLFSS